MTKKFNVFKVNLVLINLLYICLQFFPASLFAQTCNTTDYIYLNDPQDYNTQGFVHKMRIEAGGNLTEVSNGAGNMPWFPQGGGLGSPHGLGQDLNGNLYIGANGATGPIAKIKCNGTLDNLNFINDAGYNIISRDGYLYVNSSATNRISRYSLCDGSLQGYVTLNGVPDGYDSMVSIDWGLYIDSNGTMYATGGAGPFNSANVNSGPKSIYRFTPTDADFTNHTDYMPLVSGTNVPPGAAAAGLPMSSAWLWGITTDNAGNMYVVAEDPWFNHQNDTWNGVTWILKYDPNGNLIAWTSEEQTATPKTGFKGARGILYYPKLDILYLASGVNGDCISKVNPSDLSYAGAAAGNVPGQNPKTLRIATEACPVFASTKVDTTLCNASIGDKIFLSKIIGACNAPICGGTWTAASSNVGITFNQCDLSFEITGINGCGKFTLTNVGGTCGDFTIEVNVDFANITAPVIAGSQTVCSNQDPTAFTVPTPAVASSTITYQWQKSTTSCTSGFTDIAGATNSTYDPPAVTQTTYYRVIASTTGGCHLPLQKCSATSNCVTVTHTTVNCNTCTPPNAGADVTICLPKTTLDLADAPAGTTWSVGSGNPAAATINATTGVITGLTVVGTYKFVLSQTADATCKDEMQIIVTNGDVPITLCSDGSTSYTLIAQANLTNVVWYNMAGQQVGTGANLIVTSNTNGLADGSEAFYFIGQDGTASGCDVQLCCPVKFITQNCCPVPNCVGITVVKN